MTPLSSASFLRYGPIKPIRQPVPCTDDLYFIVYLRSGYVMGYSPFVYLLTENVEKQAKKYGFNVLLKPMDGRADLKRRLRRSTNPAHRAS